MPTVTLNGALFSKNVSVLKSSTAIPPISYAFELVFTLDNPTPFDGYTSAGTDKYATAVGTSNLYTIVGAPEENNIDGTKSGVAYIYSNSTGELLHTLINPNPVGTSTSDYFGSAVGITDSYAVVTAYNEADNENASSGKAYVYAMPSGNLVYTLDNPNGYETSLSDQFGRSAAISNNYVIVGAWGEDDQNGYNSGKVYLYTLP